MEYSFKNFFEKQKRPEQDELLAGALLRCIRSFCSGQYHILLRYRSKQTDIISNLQQMARTVAYVQEHGYDSYEKLSDTTDAIQSKMAKARSDAKFTEAKLKKVNEQIRYLGQYLSTKSVYGDFLKFRIFR